MAISARRHEVEAVMDAIEKATSLEETAKLALKASYAALQERPAPDEKLEKGLWVVATSDRLLYGPFGTYNEAEKAVINGKIPNLEKGLERAGEDGYIPATDVTILPLRGPLSMAKKAAEFDREARLFAGHLCSNCEHRAARHGATAGSVACTEYGCTCKKLKEVTL